MEVGIRFEKLVNQKVNDWGATDRKRQETNTARMKKKESYQQST